MVYRPQVTCDRLGLAAVDVAARLQVQARGWFLVLCQKAPMGFSGKHVFAHGCLLVAWVHRPSPPPAHDWTTGSSAVCQGTSVPAVLVPVHPQGGAG